MGIINKLNKKILMKESVGKNLPERVIALAGNPNVGKSTVFNYLTGLKQHTGNWPGKTVDSAVGNYYYNNAIYQVIDVPGTYSLAMGSAEENIANDFICNGKQLLTVVVVDATSMESGINFILEVKQIAKHILVCVNLMDEAKSKGININLRELSKELGVTVVATSARSGKGMDKLIEAIDKNVTAIIKEQGTMEKVISHNQDFCKMQECIVSMGMRAKEIYSRTVKLAKKDYNNFDRKLDKILTSKSTGIPIMIFLLLMILWITIVGANYPSQWLSNLFNWLQDKISVFLFFINTPDWLHDFLVLGVYKTVAWVVAVMLPPMAIFFPLFALLEDFGYLPRVAFNLDNVFRRCCAHGKQSLSMCMGLGCNACAIVGCRIINSPRERLIAILTNSLVPCNGRFPTIIAIITMFFAVYFPVGFKGIGSAFLLVVTILFGVSMTFLVSRILSKTILKGLPSSFILELPPYRKPRVVHVIVRSVLDRVIFVLLRALSIATVAGAVIWLCANIDVNGVSILKHCTNFLDPFARLLGLDGVILMAFILGFPANEIVFPIIIMSYLSMGSLLDMANLNELHNLLVANGWTWLTAVCSILFMLMHFPCGTTCLTIKKETKSWKWTIIAFLIPTGLGMLICFLVATISRLLGLV